MTDRMRTSRGTWATIVLLALAIIGGGIVATVVVGRQGETTTSVDDLRAQNRQLAKTVSLLEAAARQQKCDSRATSKAIGAFIHAAADNFSTPPYPDPARKDAVERMHALGDLFDRAKPTPCPRS